MKIEMLPLWLTLKTIITNKKPHSIKVNTTADPLLQLVSLATRRNLRRSPNRSRIYDVLVIPPSFSKPLGAKAIN